MDGARILLALSAALFVVVLGGMTVAVIFRSGFDVLSVIGLLVVVVLGSVAVSAARRPPDE